MATTDSTLLDDLWDAGSYEQVADRYLGMAADLVTATSVSAADAVLDVGCGTGNVALTAARRGADVTGLDITPSMLDLAEKNAAVAGLDGCRFVEGSATDIPFADDRFDVTVSSLGHMYAEPPAEAARELLRVTRPGGRIGFIAWTPDSLLPAMAAIAVGNLPQEARPEVASSPFLWGSEDAVRSRLGAEVADLSFETATVSVPALSPTHHWEAAAGSSPFYRAVLETVQDRESVHAEMVEAIDRYFDSERNAVEMTYLRTTVTVAGD